MLNRRSFLFTIGAIALGQLTGGCSRNNQEKLKVQLLTNSIPPQLLRKFRQQLEQPVNLDFKPETQLKDLFKHLQIWHAQANGKDTKRNWIPFIGGKSKEIADLITLGDYYLTDAIANQLIQPLNLEQLSGWQNLPLPWQKLVKRNEQGKMDNLGKIWGAPYRWGSTMIAYRQDKFKDLGWEPTDWSDLWREELRERISLLDQPREVIGLTLKKLGYSYNSDDLTKVANLKSELLILQKQAKFYSSDNYLQPLILGDTWLAVGWSTDILPIQTRHPDIKAIVPQSGTSLWTDLWVNPSVATDNLSLVEKWIDFCWQSQSAKQISLFSSAASPVIFNLKKDDLPKDLHNNSLLLIDKQILNSSDFLLPFNTKTEQQYQSLWQEIRQIKSIKSKI